ncbi:N-acetylmuramoyl-L-alanine amidase [Pasteurellaceae bacterium LIM206]|nr:N-acetylmuramoyl-L-alanine amidase [Pasteurellaceae bacterium LIM206]
MKRFFSLFLLSLFCTAMPVRADVWTIAIDPGHGGKDPGAIGRNLGIYEKNVTLSIARELKAILDRDPNFRAVMTRTGDYYISVPNRSDIARRKKANYLVSIHADSSANPAMKGASVWVLSNRRANDEMGQWLEDHEKQSELLGGAGSVLSGHSDEKYLNQTVLDLQFGHSQREGYELGNAILRNFSKITELSRSRPQHASLGVLRSPDIPSVLVETGFLSNTAEEAKLSTTSYRKRIAYIIYQGIVDYRSRNAGIKTNTAKVIATPTGNDKAGDAANKTKENSTALSLALQDSGVRHKVKSGETLTRIAKQYEVKAEDIIALNKLKRQKLYIGETIKIPATAKNNQNSTAVKDSIQDSGVRYKVKAGDNLTRLAQKYKVDSKDILALNQLKRQELRVGETIKIPAVATKAQDNQTVKTAKNSTAVEDSVQDSGVRYKVKSGDNLTKLAQKYKVNSKDIIALNNLKRQELRVGETIKIPGKAVNRDKVDEKKTDNKSAEKMPAKKTVTASGITHKVVAGDNLTKLAAKYEVNADDIVTLNNLKRGLLLGTTIKIPANGKNTAQSGSKTTNKADKEKITGKEKTTNKTVKEKSVTKTKTATKSGNAPIVEAKKSTGKTSDNKKAAAPKKTGKTKK